MATSRGGGAAVRRTKALGSPSASAVGPAVPSGDAAPRPGVGRAHESAGAPGVHAMAVPGMPGGQGGNLNPNRVTTSASSVPVSTPRGTNDGNHSEPTNPRLAPADGQGNGGVGEVTGHAEVPPGRGGTPLVNITRPAGPNPNNPRGQVLGDMARERGAIGSGS